MSRVTWTVVLVVLCYAAPADAQSGRKVPPRRPDLPPVAAQPAPAPPAEAAPKPEPAPKTRISVAKWVSSINLPDNIAAEVVASCTHALGESGQCQVTTGKDLNRKEATEAAKSSTETLYLWIQFSLDAADEDRGVIGPNSNTTFIATYYLLEPVTGKIRTQGRLYVSPYRSQIGNGRVPFPGGQRGSSGYSPEEAGQRAAQYVLDSLAGRSSGTPTVRF